MADDIDFKQVMRNVRPLKKGAAPAQRQPNRSLRAQIQNRALQSAAQPDETEARQMSPSNNGQSHEHGDSSLFFLRNGVQKKVLRELKKGTRYRVQNNLDLHGLTQLQAQHEIDAAFNYLTLDQLNCLLIIHGKGLHSTSGATLKEFTATYLKTLPAVKAYCSAQQRDGGSGALYVLVKG
jgi:DNA-nicking Smr family endonuclease